MYGKTGVEYSQTPQQSSSYSTDPKPIVAQQAMGCLRLGLLSAVGELAGVIAKW